MFDRDKRPVLGTGGYVAFGGSPFASTVYGYGIASKSTEVDGSVDDGTELSLFPEHRSRRYRRIVWLAQDNACREIETCAVIWGPCILGIYFYETTIKSLRNANKCTAKRRDNNTNVCL